MLQEAQETAKRSNRNPHPHGGIGFGTYLNPLPVFPAVSYPPPAPVFVISSPFRLSVLDQEGVPQKVTLVICHVGRSYVANL